MPTSKPETPAERGRDREHRLFTRLTSTPHLLRGVAVQRGGAHRPAELGEAQEQIEQQSALASADAGDQEIERADGAAADRAAASRAAGAATRRGVGRERDHAQAGRAPARCRSSQAAARSRTELCKRAQAETLDQQADASRIWRPPARIVTGSGVCRCDTATQPT